MRTASGALTVVLQRYSSSVAESGFRDANAAQNPSITDTATLKLKFDDKFFEFKAVLTSAELSCVVGEVMRVNVNYTMVVISLASRYDSFQAITVGSDCVAARQNARSKRG